MQNRHKKLTARFVNTVNAPGKYGKMRNAGLTPKQKAEIAALASMPDGDIDTSDIPVTKEFPNPRRGVFSGAPNRRAKNGHPTNLE